MGHKSKIDEKKSSIWVHFKKAIKRKELEHREFHFFPTDVTFCCYTMLSCSSYTVIYAK